MSMSLRFTEEQFAAMQARTKPAEVAAKPKRQGRAKFGNSKTYTEDGSFDSKREADRWAQLKLLEKGRLITAIGRQVRFDLNDGGTYVADFVYLDREAGVWVVEDCKGFRTPEYIRKRGLMSKIHGIKILET